MPPSNASLNMKHGTVSLCRSDLLSGTVMPGQGTASQPRKFIEFSSSSDAAIRPTPRSVIIDIFADISKEGPEPGLRSNCTSLRIHLHAPPDPLNSSRVSFPARRSVCAHPVASKQDSRIESGAMTLQSESPSFTHGPQIEGGRYDSTSETWSLLS